MTHAAFSSLMVVALVSQGSAGAAPTTDGPLTYEQHIRPILKANCFYCHGEEEKHEGSLDVRLRRLLVKGGDSGPAIEPGKPEASLLLERIQQGDMPPGEKKLSPKEVALIGRWIAAGAKTARPEPEDLAGIRFTPEERQFWAFQPIQTPPVPTIKTGSAARTAVDAFVFARLEKVGLTFSPDADKRTLLRRAYFDLIGLPPSAEEIDQFLKDESPDAYERLIDRLLASPRYGERWGRHWLDVAGYADSEGYSPDDRAREHAYKYRDYVIRSFNDDKPFDQFIREQLAGDEMLRPPYKNLKPDEIEKLVATGFLRMAPDGTGSGDVDQNVARNQVVADTIKIVSTSLMGLSVACAQCHDHRYDPIPQDDYYRMRAIFEPGYDWKSWRVPRGRQISLYTEEDIARAKQVEAKAVEVEKQRLQKQTEYIEQTFEKQLAKLPEEVREPIRVARKTPADKRTAEQKELLKANPSVNVTAGSLYLYDQKAADDLKALADQAKKVRDGKPVEDFIRAFTEVPGKVPATFLFYRGDHAQPKQKLAPGDLSILDAAHSVTIAEKDSTLPTTGRRLAFAQGLTDGKHPLTARVLVNRVWHHHFGKGIVGTPGDFGLLGERPTHPELLDWLASDFMQGGWKVKRLHKLLMTSTAYRQASQRDSKRDSIDPDNRLYSRMTTRRLEAEVIRDAILAVSGKLNAKMFGPVVPVMEDEVGQFVVGIENKNGENRPGEIIPMNGEEFRRSVYVQFRRSRPLAVLDTFDSPAMEPNCELRNASTVAPQSLLLMNSQFVVDQAEFFADRLLAGAKLEGQEKSRAALAWRLAFARDATDQELAGAVAFLQAQELQFREAAKSAAAQAGSKKDANKAPTPDAEKLALANLCQALFSANEFLYVD